MAAPPIAALVMLVPSPYRKYRRSKRGPAHGSATPSGHIARETHEFIKAELLSSLQAALPVDAVCLALHGAGVEPAIKALNELCWELEGQPGVIDCTLFHGFARSDTPHTGMSVVVVTDDDPALARRTAGTVRERLLSLREQLRADRRGLPPVTADGPGLSARDVRLWPYQNLRRPLWPFE